MYMHTYIYIHICVRNIGFMSCVYIYICVIMGSYRGYIGARLEFEGFREDSKEQFPFLCLP